MYKIQFNGTRTELAWTPEKGEGVIVCGVSSEILRALLENNTYKCCKCGEEVVINQDKGDVLMHVRHQMCPDCYVEANKDM